MPKRKENLSRNPGRLRGITSSFLRLQDSIDLCDLRHTIQAAGTHTPLTSVLLFLNSLRCSYLFLYEVYDDL